MAFKRYIRLILTGGLLTVLAVSVFNWFNDPYGIFGAPRLSWFNEAKPFAGDRGRIAKLYQAQRIRPKGLIVGNSRPEMGLDPDHRCWPGTARPVYNTALPGLGVYHQVRYAQHAIAAGAVSTLVMGVDFLDFIVAGNDDYDGGDPSRWPPAGMGTEDFLVGPNGHAAPSYRLAQAKNYLAAALSLDALGHSLFTFARQGGAFVTTRTQGGFNPAERFYEPIVQTEGVGVLFAQKNREIANRLNGGNWKLYQGPTKWSADFEALRRLLRQGRAGKVDVVMFINPYHAEYLAMIELAGLWPLFEEWKSRLVETARAEGTPLWDFSGFDRFSSENIQDIAEKGEKLSWFWEPSHYRKELGDLVLANIWRPHCPSPDQIESYGVRIDMTDITRHLAVLRLQKDQYMASHGPVADRLRKLVAHRGAK